MKNLLFLLLLFIHNIGAFCQNNDNYDFRVQYDMQLNLSGNISYQANLYFNNTQSLFEYHENPFGEEELVADEKNLDFDQSNNVSYNLRIRDSVRYYMRYNRDNNLIEEFISGFDNKELYNVKESAPKIIWTICEDHKKISSYECKKATCSFRGRKFFAWFTTEVQTNFGPLKLHGLPGLIMELFDEEKEVILSVIIVKKEKSSIGNIPLSTKTISRLEYLKIKAEEIKKVEEILKRISSKPERGLKVSAKINSIKSIEID